jgi:hypothetical protein
MLRVKKKGGKSGSNDQHNLRRRTLYENDKDYRENAKNVARKNYRKLVKKELMPCDRNLASLASLAIPSVVVHTAGKNKGKQATIPILNIPRTALALDKLYQNVWRWIGKDMLPAPVIKLLANEQPVYHVSEVEVFIQVLGKHFGDFAYYRKDHEATRSELYDKANKVRIKLNLI